MPKIVRVGCVGESKADILRGLLLLQPVPPVQREHIPFEAVSKIVVYSALFPLMVSLDRKLIQVDCSEMCRNAVKTF